MSVDYLKTYMTGQGFDFPRLLNDDFFQPVRILYNARHYVSATKLLLVAIDSMGFIEYGDTGTNTFTKWLDSYADLGPVGVTAEELWEHRNSLLHMSNLDSRRVVAGNVRRILSYVGTLPSDFPRESAQEKYYSLMDLIRAVAGACTRWAESYNMNRRRFETFLDRYDLIVSDSRMSSFDVGDRADVPETG